MYFLRGSHNQLLIAAKYGKRFICGLHNLSKSRALILNYHRVSPDLENDPFEMAVTPDNFVAQLEVLRKIGRPMRLCQFASLLNEGNFSDRAIVVTFDDGYVDNFLYAKPLLESYSVPATIFVTSGHIDSNDQFWWDELSQLLLRAKKLPAVFYLSRNTITGQLHLQERLDKRNFRCQKIWRMAIGNDQRTRLRVLRDIRQLFFVISCEERQRILNELTDLLEPQAVPQARSHLSSSELLSLVQGGLIDIGAHTVSHPVLSTLPEHEQQQEIQESKRKLEDILHSTVDSFSYPFGQPIDYTQKTVSIVKESGFSCACSTFSHYVQPKANCYDLPRWTVRNCRGGDFERQLKKILGV